MSVSTLLFGKKGEKDVFMNWNFENIGCWEEKQKKSEDLKEKAGQQRKVNMGRSVSRKKEGKK